MADEHVATTKTAIDAVWRIESARLIAGLARIVRDVGLAEDLAQDALVIALEQWPGSGIPNNPGAWLMATARHRAIDRIRRNVALEQKHAILGRELQIQEELAGAEFETALDDDVGDDLLRLMFTACHPVLSTEARVALTLRLLGGLTTEEIARAFLASEATIAQRIVRAKRTLVEARVWHRCWKSSISSSTKATRPPPATTGPGRDCARRRCAWDASWPSWRRTRLRRTGWWP
jgi:RNA polymerase sigma factor (sigma-70 family)